MNKAAGTLNNLHRLYEDFGQSAWLDNLRRDWIDSGELQKWIDAGCRGITSNPTIFAKSMSGSEAYDSQLKELGEERSIENVYWQLILKDISSALQMLYPVYESSNGKDGYVSVEVSPTLADSVQETIAAARDLAKQLDAPNLYIKVPATEAGVAAIKELVSVGISINVTLIFSLERYGEVMDAYIEGLAACEGDLSKIHSVASFFVSRVDTEVDRQLLELNTPEALSAQGTAAVAQAQLAYQMFLERFQQKDFVDLLKRGANLQRPLWASVSTKNPNYADTLYVDSLIGPDTVSTMPEDTLSAFLDHGNLARTLDADFAKSQAAIDKLTELGIDMQQVAQKLESEGVSAFSKSFEEALDGLQSQRDELDS